MKSSPSQILGWTGSDWVYAPFSWSDDLTTAKSYMVNVTKQQARDYLQPTDWFCLRKVENDTPIPEDWSTWRQAIRDEVNQKNSEIETCESKELLKEYCQSDAYLIWLDPPSSPA